MQQRHVGPPVAQQPFLFADPAQENVDGGRAGFGGVGGEHLRQQLAGCSGLRDENEAGMASSGECGAPGPAVGGVDGVEGRPALDQQHGPGLGQRDGAAGAVEQGHAEPPFELTDRPRQRRLRHPQPLRGTPEVQLLGDRDEVPQLAWGIAAHPTRIVNMSSSVGSLTRQTASADEQVLGPLSAAYTPSKTMLNALTIQYAKELRDTNILINAACPGYVATDLNGFRGVRTPEQGAAIALRLATLPDDGPSGGFFEDAGVVPW